MGFWGHSHDNLTVTRMAPLIWSGTDDTEWCLVGNDNGSLTQQASRHGYCVCLLVGVTLPDPHLRSIEAHYQLEMELVV